ncbi:MAG: DapH/DapD/GlmU-related protein [Cyanobacteria bacterium P01_D01_bin.115]
MSICHAFHGLKEFGKRIFVHALLSWLGPLHSHLGVLLRRCTYPAIFGKFGEQVSIAPLVEFVNPAGIFIKSNVKIEPGVSIRSHGAMSKIVLHRNVSLDKCVNIKTHKFGRIEIGHHTDIGPFTCLSGDSIIVGNDCLIASHCSIYANNHTFSDPETLIRRQGHSYKGITIAHNCWIGTGVSILDGVTVGEGSVVGAGSVVTKSIPPFSVALGVPAKVIKRRKRRSSRLLVESSR